MITLVLGNQVALLLAGGLLALTESGASLGKSGVHDPVVLLVVVVYVGAREFLL